MTIQCHWCGTVENLKATVCEGHCPREQQHNTSVCKNCYLSKIPDAAQTIYDNWDKTTYHYKTKLKEFDPTKMYSDIVHYYVDKKGYPLAKAEEIAKQKIREQQQVRGLIPS